MKRKGEKDSLEQENLAGRERGSALLREFARIVETFHKVLLFKDQKRLSLQESTAGLAEKIKSNKKNLKVVLRNLEIYKQNSAKITQSLKEMRDRELLIKEKFQRLLDGAPPDEDDLPGGLPAIHQDEKEQKVIPINFAGTLSRESLIKRRQVYLECLNSVFKKLENELSSIEEVKRELEQARVDLSIKQEEMNEKKSELEDVHYTLRDRYDKLQAELEKSVKEERIILRGFDQILAGVESHCEIRDEVDQLLFSQLSDSPFDAGASRETANRTETSGLRPPGGSARPTGSDQRASG